MSHGQVEVEDHRMCGVFAVKIGLREASVDLSFAFSSMDFFKNSITFSFMLFFL